MVNKNLKLLIISDDKKLKDVLEFCFDGWGYKVFFEDFSVSDLPKIVRISPDVIVIDVQSGTKSRLEICNNLKVDFATAYIPIVTLIDKRQLRQQLLSLKQGVDDYLIKPPDPLDLRVRIEMAIKRSQHSFYANSLTGLPGGVMVEDTIKGKMESGEHFVTGHVDIDNFKSFNDKYGYLKGDRVIMQTAYMLTAAVRSWGNKDDFVGHIGGDDFVMITTPDKYNEICKNFICMFDTTVPFHYSEKDRGQNYVVSKDRTGKVRKIPLMSVTIALFMKNSSEEVHNILQLNDRIVEVKQYLKKIEGSKYMADRRILNRDDHLTVQLFKNDDSLVANYKPLGQILLDEKIITSEQLDIALKMHWRSGELLGEVLKDLSYITDQKLSEALASQGSELEPTDRNA